LDILATKCDNRETVISITCNQFSKSTNTCPQPWPPLINGLVDDALLEHNYFRSSSYVCTSRPFCSNTSVETRV